MATKTKKKVRTKKSATNEVMNFGFKTGEKEGAYIQRLADQITKGNVSALVKGALKFAPLHKTAIQKMEFRATTRR